MAQESTCKLQRLLKDPTFGLDIREIELQIVEPFSAHWKKE